MLYCEPCRIKMGWPQGFMMSRGPCEECLEVQDCYDVHHSLLPINNTPQPKRDVHTAHCCQRHGCKYGKDQICTVVRQLGNQEYMCPECDYEINEAGGWEDAQLLNEMYEKGKAHGART